MSPFVSLAPSRSVLFRTVTFFPVLTDRIHVSGEQYCEPTGPSSCNLISKVKIQVMFPPPISWTAERAMEQQIRAAYVQLAIRAKAYVDGERRANLGAPTASQNEPPASVALAVQATMPRKGSPPMADTGITGVAATAAAAAAAAAAPTPLPVALPVVAGLGDGRYIGSSALGDAKAADGSIGGWLGAEMGADEGGGARATLRRLDAGRDADGIDGVDGLGHADVTDGMGGLDGFGEAPLPEVLARCLVPSLAQRLDAGADSRASARALASEARLLRQRCMRAEAALAESQAEVTKLTAQLRGVILQHKAQREREVEPTRDGGLLAAGGGMSGGGLGGGGGGMGGGIGGGGASLLSGLSALRSQEWASALPWGGAAGAAPAGAQCACAQSACASPGAAAGASVRASLPPAGVNIVPPAGVHGVNDVMRRVEASHAAELGALRAQMMMEVARRDAVIERQEAKIRSLTRLLSAKEELAGALTAFRADTPSAATAASPSPTAISPTAASGVAAAAERQQRVQLRRYNLATSPLIMPGHIAE